MRFGSSTSAMILSLLLTLALCMPACAQTSVALSVYGAFSHTATGRAVRDIPSNAAGGIVEVRHIVNPLVGFEATYSLNRANQVYDASRYCSICVPVSVSANAHEITGDWVFSFPAAKLRPFVLVGAGILYFQALDSIQFNHSAPTRNSTTPVYVYGFGVDWRIIPHIGLRLQYRGNFYNAPDLTKVFGAPAPQTGNGTVFTHAAEPAIGVYYRF